MLSVLLNKTFPSFLPFEEIITLKHLSFVGEDIFSVGTGRSVIRLGYHMTLNHTSIIQRASFFSN